MPGPAASGGQMNSDQAGPAMAAAAIEIVAAAARELGGWIDGGEEVAAGSGSWGCLEVVVGLARWSVAGSIGRWRHFGIGRRWSSAEVVLVVGAPYLGGRGWRWKMVGIAAGYPKHSCHSSLPNWATRFQTTASFASMDFVTEASSNQNASRATTGSNWTNSVQISYFKLYLCSLCFILSCFQDFFPFALNYGYLDSHLVFDYLWQLPKLQSSLTALASFINSKSFEYDLAYEGFTTIEALATAIVLYSWFAIYFWAFVKPHPIAVWARYPGD